MRVHIKDGFAQAAIDKVFLDGVEQKYCTMADTALGAVERAKVKDGKILYIDNTVCMEEVNGKVEITFREGWGMNELGQYTINGEVILKENNGPR